MNGRKIVSRQELLTLAAVAACLVWFFISVEAFEWTFEASRKYEHLQLDEFIVLVPVMAIVLSIFSFNRFKQLRKEMLALGIAEREAYRFATTNAVTGLSNDRVTFAAIENAASAKPAGGFAVAIIHLGHWRLANVRHGSTVASGIICAALEKLKMELPTEAILGCSETGKIIVAVSGYTPERFASTCLQRIVTNLEAAVEAEGVAMVAPVHIGVSSMSSSATGMTLLAQAQSALMEANKNDESTIRLFSTKEESAKSDRKRLIDALRTGLKEGEIFCQFQPILDLATMETTSFEALARWRRKDGTSVSPEVFIPLCNEAGLSFELTRVVLQTALSTARNWPEKYAVGVNISRAELAMPQLFSFIRASLLENNIAPYRLEIEVTETDALQDAYNARRNIDALRRLGVKIAIDDFGAGFSNLSVLHEIDFDTIKIDREFAVNLAVSSKDRAIVAATVALAKSLNRSVTIEGIENLTSLNAAIALGCTKAQGYFFAKPLDPGQINGYLADRNNASLIAAA